MTTARHARGTTKFAKMLSLLMVRVVRLLVHKCSRVWSMLHFFPHHHLLVCTSIQSINTETFYSTKVICRIELVIRKKEFLICFISIS